MEKNPFKMKKKFKNQKPNKKTMKRKLKQLMSTEINKMFELSDKVFKELK